MYWKFICTSNTEAECFQRGLFGASDKFWNEVKDIKKGDIIFLFNIETDVIFGPFVAADDGSRDLEKDAWSGRFPAQVRVEWKLLSFIREASRKFNFLKEKSLKLSDEQGAELLNSLAYCPSSDVKKEIQSLDADIHSLAHKLEEVYLLGRGHPADRLIELDRLKGEFITKMRDFVWAVRKFDRDTKILDLPSNRGLR